nr:hypothetical protein [Tanacetum cinerariifolium]
MTTSVRNNSVFRSFFEKQKLTGPKFIDWYRQLRLVLSNKDKENYLEHPIPVAPPGQQVPPKAFAAHATWVKRQKEVVVLMLLTMDLEIQQNLAHLVAYDMLQKLKAMYSKQAKQELLQTVREFHTSKQEKGQSVSLHVLKMKGYIDNLVRLGQPVGQNLAVSLILVSLNKDFDSFVHNYNMHDMGKSVNELHDMLKLHEETLPKKDANPALYAIRAGSTPPPPREDNPAKDAICHQCGEVGHWRKNCPTYLVELMKKKKLSQGASTSGDGHRTAVEAIGTYHLELPSGLVIVLNNCLYAPSITRGVISVLRLFDDGFINRFDDNNVISVSRLFDDGFINRFDDNNVISVSKNNLVYFMAVPQDGYPKETIGYSFYNPSENKVFVARNAEFFESKLLELKVSGSVEDLELIQKEDTNPSVNTSLNHKEDDQEINEPQSDINPIPALLDPESKKWLDAMNVEMQSMKDNDVWVLVELPPNVRTVGSKWLFKKKTDMDGAVCIFKARLVAKGFTQSYEVDYEETFSLVADIRAIRILIAIAAYYDYEIWQMDVKTAFLNGHLSEEVYMEKHEGFRMQNIPYASAVGSILYAVRCTRPDVAFAQNMTSHFQQNSSEEHWTAVKYILKYLRNTKDMFLVYRGNMERELRVSCYTDAGYLTDADNLKSQTGYVFVLNGGAVDWKKLAPVIRAKKKAYPKVEGFDLNSSKSCRSVKRASVARANKKASSKVLGFKLKSAHCKSDLGPEI